MHPVEIVRKVGGTIARYIDRGGAVFVPAPARGIVAPVYVYGHPEAKTKDALFSCPISAIPSAIWDVLELWLQSRALRVPVVAGGVLDQPLIVRRAFPIFELEQSARDYQRNANASASGAAAVLAAIGGGGRRR